MANRPSGITKRIEVWNTRQGVLIKTAVRHSDGKLHGATNFNFKPGKVRATPQA